MKGKKKMKMFVERKVIWKRDEVHSNDTLSLSTGLLVLEQPVVWNTCYRGSSRYGFFRKQRASPNFWRKPAEVHPGFSFVCLSERVQNTASRPVTITITIAYRQLLDLSRRPFCPRALRPISVPLPDSAIVSTSRSAAGLD